MRWRPSRKWDARWACSRRRGEQDRAIEALRLEASKWVGVRTYRGDELVRVEPFEAVEIDLLPVWGESRG